METDSLTLKKIDKASIPEALSKAAQYRLLAEPHQAESICTDVLEADPTNQAALVLLILAITDQFGGGSGNVGVQRAKKLLTRLGDEYEQHYYAGIICEREARAFMQGVMSGTFAYNAFRHAMTHFEDAEKVRPSGNDDALLHWNSCLRTIRENGLRPPAKEKGEHPLE